MSLTIDSTLEYLQSRLGLSEAKIQEYQNYSVEEIIKAEAAQGNQAAIQLAADMFTDSKQLIELFQLADPQNKLAILQTMNTQQLEELIPMLETEDLLEGLNYFTQDALLDMLEKLPKEELVKTVFQLFSPERLMELMPEEQLDKVLTSVEMDKGLVLNNLKNLPEMYLQQALESVTGESEEGSSIELASKIGQLGDLQYKDTLRHLEPEQKRKFSLAIMSSDEKYYQSFDADAYTKIMDNYCEKPDIIKGMEVIKPEHLQKMIEKLPQDLLSVVITMMDTEKFADMLIQKNPETLAKLIAA